MKNKLVCGVGINDAGYVIQIMEDIIREDGTHSKKLIWVCPYYQKWKNMLTRCYTEKELLKNPSYRGCTVCDEWLTFSNFKFWMEKQDWQGNQLDKDLLLKDNKVYSAATCLFVTPAVNVFLTDRANGRGDYPLGVCYHKDKGELHAQGNDGSGRRISLGFFNTPEEAHSLKHKLSRVCALANEQTDERVAEALRKRYSKEEWQGNK